jgi:hypothetical protein
VPFRRPAARAPGASVTFPGEKWNVKSRKSGRRGAVIRRDWLTLHYPPYWHYDILQSAAGAVPDGAHR